jgi:hypothetical protein
MAIGVIQCRFSPRSFFGSRVADEPEKDKRSAGRAQ